MRIITGACEKGHLFFYFLFFLSFIFGNDVGSKENLEDLDFVELQKKCVHMYVHVHGGTVCACVRLSEPLQAHSVSNWHR